MSTTDQYTWLVCYNDGNRGYAVLYSDASKESVEMLCDELNDGDIYVSAVIRLAPEQINSEDYEVFVEDEWLPISSLREMSA